MTRTVFYTATTLDGYLADENDSLDWLFVHDMDQEGALGYEQFIGGVGALVMGRTTYQWVVDHQTARSVPWPYAMPTWVVTHVDGLSVMDGADIRFGQGDVAPLHEALVDAAAGKDVWIVGGGDLAAQFAEAGLLDQLMLAIAPVTLGAGRPLFPRRVSLELTSVRRNRAFICATYDVVGRTAETPGNDTA